MTIQLNGKTPTKITIRKSGNNFATQGPSPDGYHVPSKDEWVALVAAMTALGIDTSNGNCMKTYMKMPMAGQRSYSSAGVNGQGTNAYYWSSSAYSTDYAYVMDFFSAGLSPQTGYNRSQGCSVRCFKNTPVTPGTVYSQWTRLYGTGQGITPGIYAGGELTGYEVISISTDGENWKTISAKNLGATTVYNDGNTLSQANCGNYYQWGNNYGFAWTGSVTTSSTKVDASTYGPGNYYSSSTFITVSASPYDWSSVRNDNLRGGEDGNIPMLEEKEIKKIVIFPDGVTEKQIRPAFQTYSYDFKGKSTSQMQSDGWTGTFNGNTSSSGISNGFLIYKDILNLSSAKKITVKTGFNVTQKTSWSSGAGGTTLRQNDSDGAYGGASSTLSTSGWCGIVFNYGSGRTNWNSYNIPIGSGYINEWEIDFPTKVASVKLYQGTTLLTSITYNLSDTQITEIRAKTKLNVATDGPGFQITTVESTVE